MPFERVSLQLLEGDLRSLVAAHGFDRRKVDRFLLRPISSDKLVRRIRDSREPIFAPDTSQLEDWPHDSDHARPIKAWIGYPVIKDGKVDAFITFDFFQKLPEIDAYRADVQRFAEELQHLLLVARPLLEVERLGKAAALVKETMDWIARHPDLNRILQRIVDCIAEELNCAHCTLFLPEASGGKLYLTPRCSAGGARTMDRSFGSHEGLVGFVFRTGRPLVEGRAHQHPNFAPGAVPSTTRSMLVAPSSRSHARLGLPSSAPRRSSFWRRSAGAPWSSTLSGSSSRRSSIGLA
jgi:GAF domain-containing protein